MKPLLLAAALWAVPVCAQAPPAAAKPKPVARVQPPARIMDFKASSTNLQPGQSTTLVWSTENPTTTVISGLGEVTAIGNRSVTPKATTTYTLTVRGPNGEESRSLTINVAGTTAIAAVTATEAPKATPRTAEGKPDFTGIYNSSSFVFAGRQVRGQNSPFTGKLKPGAESFKVARGPNDAGQYSTCMPTGLPGAYFVPYQWQIVQGKDSVVIMYEYPHLFRVIPIAGPNNVAEHPVDPDPSWMGNSIGRWDGDTLVVDVVGFNDKTELPGGFRHTEALHVVERFTRTDFENLDYVATIEDPNVFAEPWKIERGFPLRADLQTLSEFVCENNRDYTPFFEKK
ncbi:MAG: hypothetical protein ABI811_01645 [Acidobacteriota bacterium]